MTIFVYMTTPKADFSIFRFNTRCFVKETVCITLNTSRGRGTTRCLCQTSDNTEAPPTPQLIAYRGPEALKMINGLDVYCDMLPRQLVYSSLSTIYAAPQTLDTGCIFILSSMHIHGKVDGARGRMCMSSQHSAKCRSRRRMLIQLYGSCSLVPMATVFALEQKSCISSLAIKDHCQA